MTDPLGRFPPEVQVRGRVWEEQLSAVGYVKRGYEVEIDDMLELLELMKYVVALQTDNKDLRSENEDLKNEVAEGCRHEY